MISRLLALAAFLIALPVFAADKEEEWKPLWSGKDFTGWDKWLGKPYKEKTPVGLDNDTRSVYTIAEVDGKPAIRISGEIFGALTTKDEFENYHLRLEFKWGDKKWPPREKAVRDSGLLYHCVGAHGGTGNGAWMESAECQIQEKDCGDFWSVGGVLVDVEGDRPDAKGSPTFHKGAGKHTIGGPGKTERRIIKSADHEKAGVWNTIEVLTVDGVSVHLVNGKPVMVLSNIRRKVDDKEEPLRRGKLQLQSEGAEIYYRNIEIKPIKKIPASVLP